MNELTQWIKDSETKSELHFRQVVHIILHAISRSRDLQPQMLMKGGILMAIRYNTGRLTRDVDFSTQKHYRDFQENGQEAFISLLDSSIRQSAELLDYGIRCRIQSHKIKPREEGNFQTLELKVGYAIVSEINQLKRLEKGSSPHIVSIDYSFNEIISDISFLQVEDDIEIQTYGEITLLAEKLRAILQQEENKKSRGQDIYDIHYFLKTYGISEDKKSFLLTELINKAASRNLHIHHQSILSPVIYDRSKIRYEALKDEIELLPDFDEAFNIVKDFYISLPWLISSKENA